MATLPEPKVPSSVSSLSEIPDEEIDKAVPGKQLVELGPLQLPELIFGAGAFSGIYNTDDHLNSLAPIRTARLALRYGMCAFDTSPYYGPSEIVLGDVLSALGNEFPRSSYQLMTKCGRYGVDHFDYSPATIRKSVLRSLSRMRTDYLDAVYLHDVEFVATQVTPRTTGNHTQALTEEAELYGLLEAQKDKIFGEGDQVVLDAIAELRKMQDEGLIKNVGITGYPLPTLLRLSILTLNTAPFWPLDVVLSYSHLNLQDQTFTPFAPYFSQRAKIRQLIVASPLSMGLLAPRPPAWHPAPAGLRNAVQENVKLAEDWEGGLPNLAQGFAIRYSGLNHGGIPLVAGLSTLQEVHECVQIWREVREGRDNGRTTREARAQQVFANAGFTDWSWASP